MKKELRIWDLIIRYAILVFFGILNNWFFYLIFTPLTIYPSFFILSFFYSPSLISNTIIINNFPIQLISACIAGSAYYLLLILNLSTSGIKFGKRIGILLFSFTSLLVINILRIVILSAMFVAGVSFFDIAHELFWYVGSTIFVVGIWFLSVWIFKIKDIPFYSDIKSLMTVPKKTRRKKH